MALSLAVASGSSRMPPPKPCSLRRGSPKPWPSPCSCKPACRLTLTVRACARPRCGSKNQSQCCHRSRWPKEPKWRLQLRRAGRLALSFDNTPGHQKSGSNHPIIL
ncbi:hypothetical protein XAC902_510036 [Xanthomonas citri pv. citri]|nr:hypothetical protein XAC902_510036 [Xanthomonas citri pv. citri]